MRFFSISVDRLLVQSLINLPDEHLNAKIVLWDLMAMDLSNRDLIRTIREIIDSNYIVCVFSFQAIKENMVRLFKNLEPKESFFHLFGHEDMSNPLKRLLLKNWFCDQRHPIFCIGNFFGLQDFMGGFPHESLKISTSRKDKELALDELLPEVRRRLALSVKPDPERLYLACRTSNGL